jgi:hypothetical protein
MPVEVTVNGKPVKLKPIEPTPCPPPEVKEILKQVSELLGKAAN